MMFRSLLARTFRDGWSMLASCAAFTALFVFVRVFASSKIELDKLLLMVSRNLKFVQDLLPVSIEELTSPLGRSAFAFEELPVLMGAGIWAVARGTDCIAGRVGSGTMEMLLAQPVRRTSLIASHTLVTLVGAIVVALAAWAGVAVALQASSFENPPAWTAMWPAVTNLLSFELLMIGAATLSGALFQSRGTAVGIVIGVFLIQLATMIIGRLLPQEEWIGWLTVLSAYQPTKLALGVAREPQATLTAIWQYNATLAGMGAAMLVAAVALFNRRDVPAPL